MKTFKFLLPIVAMLLIGFSSCSKDDDPTVEPPIEVVYKTFVIEMEELTPGDYRFAIELAHEIGQIKFPNSIVTRKFSIVTVKMPESDVAKFMLFMEKVNYVSFEELK